MITWILLAISATLVLTNSLWWLIFVLLLSGFKLNKWYFYKSRPWRRIHFPAMRLYAIAAGTESAEAHNNSKDFNIRSALVNLLCMLEPEWSHDTSENFVDIALSKCESWSDENLIRSTFKKRNDNLTGSDLDELMGALNESLKRTDNSWIVRIVIAEMIENQFSIEDRGEYLVECIEGQAK